MRSMIIKFIGTVALASSALTSAPSFAKDYKPQMGKAYFLTIFHGLKDTPNRELTRPEIEDITYLDLRCQGDLSVQRPSGWKEVAHSTLMGLIGAGGGTAAGYAADGLSYTTAKTGLRFGGPYGAVSGLIGGIDGRKRANRYDIGQCVMQAINGAQQQYGRLIGIGIIINSHAISGKGIKRLTVVEGGDTPAAGAQRPAVGSAPPPPIQ